MLVTTEQVFAVAGAIAVGLLSLLGALLTLRVLGRTGSGLRALDTDLATRPASLSHGLARVRSNIHDVDAQTEHALWTLANLDEHIDAASAVLRARRDASDRLRSRLVDGEESIARLRDTIRLLMRLNDLRRDFWA